MKYKKKSYRKIMGEYELISHARSYQFSQSKKIYTARTEKEVLQYLKEKGIL